MKFVSYTKTTFYFLTDSQFASAMEMWTKGQSVYVESVGALLPPPKGPVGTLPENLDMVIYYCSVPAGFPGSPGWVGYMPSIKNPDGSEMARAAIYYRAKELGAEELEYRWAEINVRNPSVVGGMGMVDHGTTTEDVLGFMDRLPLTPIDDVLSGRMRSAVDLDPLLPGYYLS